MIIPADLHAALSTWLTHYGSFALFILLALGIVGLPIPDETLLVFAGYLAAKGHTSIYGVYAAGLFGSSIGVTLSYLLGYFTGKKLLPKYGRWIGATEKNLQKVHNWFEHVGKWTITIGYFIPGVRHLTGIFAGIAYLEYWRFAIFAYTGALLWTSTFVSIGYFFYESWRHLSV